jgi:predicted RNA-binding protein with PUA-like domain
MKQMRKGDLAFFYHSNEGKEIIGIVKIVRPYYPDPTDDTGNFGCVDVTAVRPLKNSVSLTQIKKKPSLKNMGLIRQSRLSIMPLTQHEWEIVLKMEND